MALDYSSPSFQRDNKPPFVLIHHRHRNLLSRAPGPLAAYGRPEFLSFLRIDSQDKLSPFLRFLRLTEQRCSNSRNVRLNASLNSHIYKFHEPVDLEWSLNRALYSGREMREINPGGLKKNKYWVAVFVVGQHKMGRRPSVKQTGRSQNLFFILICQALFL